MANNTLEQIKREAAKALIAQPLGVQIGADTLKMQRPTLRTIIAMSEQIYLLKEAEAKKKGIAEYAKPIGKIYATMLLGRPKAINLVAKWRFRRMVRRIEERYTPQELLTSLGEIFAKMGVQDFFVLTTSLTILNEREVVTSETTAHGR
ncbi:MAG: hypothetical protein IJP79_07235 [Paludibacteraceae bacterium]|nr:hypothetical protein [Paludibacteraceae bacterium]MBQ6963477.1 hypothetical protein [Paludibacteraceae bacterium]MBQ7662509.1 hypothetical protein [Prevotella sp.]MBQ7748266.1 hypothetical protein [Paludibacteraceae bacterium]